MAAYEQILCELKDGVATVTLNRPERLNAWTAQMAAEVRDAITGAGADPEARVIVVTGAGRGFCAGADMGGLQDISKSGRLQVAEPEGPGEAAARTSKVGPAIADRFPGRFGWMFDVPKPILFAINGPCVGIGMVFTLYGDLRYVAEEAFFSTAFSARGLIAEHGCAWLLPRLVGEANALDLLFTARRVPGAEAAAMGLVNRALPGAELTEHVGDLARRLATDVSPRSLAIMKRQIRASAFQSFAESLEIANAEMEASFGTPDFREGVASFSEKRKPAFPPL